MTETEEKHNAPTIVDGMYAGKTTGCMYSSEKAPRSTHSATVSVDVNSEDRLITTASSRCAHKTSTVFGSVAVSEATSTRGQQFESMPMTRKAEREDTGTNKEYVSVR